tara:strand:+ start:309 stop:533 length:225 start_codon:yes stop_codon:yes gene_type:complete
MVESETLDIKNIITNAIINGEDFPLKLTSKDKAKFAGDVANLCDKHAFDRTRDDFKKQVKILVEDLIKRNGGLD